MADNWYIVVLPWHRRSFYICPHRYNDNTAASSAHYLTHSPWKLPAETSREQTCVPFDLVLKKKLRECGTAMAAPAMAAPAAPPALLVNCVGSRPTRRHSTSRAAIILLCAQLESDRSHLYHVRVIIQSNQSIKFYYCVTSITYRQLKRVYETLPKK